MADFTPQIQQWVLASEGGYVDHPDDPLIIAMAEMIGLTSEQVDDLWSAAHEL